VAVAVLDITAEILHLKTVLQVGLVVGPRKLVQVVLEIHHQLHLLRAITVALEGLLLAVEAVVLAQLELTVLVPTAATAGPVQPQVHR
jgi:hypothetical protein